MVKVSVQSGVWRPCIVGFYALAILILFSFKPSSTKTVSAHRQANATAAILRPYNIVLITLDTVRPDHLHCYGYRKIKTPVIDGLAKNGVLFEKAVTQTPLTEPSHASIFTGTNPNVHHVRNTGGFSLQTSSVTLATLLQRQGWQTAGFISATVLQREFGFNQGFAVYDDQMPETNGDSEFRHAASRAANITVDHALSWLNTQPGKPFFIWVHLYDAHAPYNSPPQFRKEYPRDPYDATIAFEDQQLGRFLAAVRQKSPAGKTLIVLLSDHGEGLGQHGEEEHGVFLYDSTVRIAWIMAGPGVPAGVRVQQQAREIDALPTILALLGGKPSSAVQGTSMVPSFSGATVPTDDSYEETLYPKINMGWSELRGIHTAHWMYVRAPRPELYNLDQDPGELKNVIDAYPKEYRELAAQLKKLSNIGSGQTDKIVASPMDRQTMEQLRSLGYVSGPSEGNIDLNGTGADPKDRLAVLKIFDTAAGPAGEKLPPARKIALLQQGLKEDPTNPSLYYTLGKQYSRIGQNDRALQTYLAALNHGIQNGLIYTLLGNVYLRGGHPKEAVLFFGHALQSNPHDVEKQTDLANAYIQTGQVADAERTFHSVIATEPYAPAYAGLGFIALQRHDFSVAQDNFNRAIQLDPDDVEALYNLGNVCLQTHDVPCARTAFKAFLAKVSPPYKQFVPQVKAVLISLH